MGPPPPYLRQHWQARVSHVAAPYGTPHQSRLLRRLGRLLRRLGRLLRRLGRLLPPTLVQRRRLGAFVLAPREGSAQRGVESHAVLQEACDLQRVCSACSGYGMQCACSMHAVDMDMQWTCSAYEVRMQCPHADHMQTACSPHVAHMQRACHATGVLPAYLRPLSHGGVSACAASVALAKRHSVRRVALLRAMAKG